MIECYGLRRERVKETSKRKLHVYSTMEEIYTKIIACGVHVKYLRVGRVEWVERMKRVERWRGWRG